MHSLPVFGWHVVGQLHELVQTRTPQGSPLGHLSVAPGAHAPWPVQLPLFVQPPHSQPAPQVRVWVCVPQLPHATVRVSVAPAVHEPPPLHAPNAPNAPHVHDAEQVRVRVWVPQPHACASVSTAPAAQTPSPSHANPVHVHASLHVRRAVPQLPHDPPVSMSPGEHSPAPMQSPSFVHDPAAQTWRCVPHRPHGTVRGGAPSSQSQLEGASHAPQTPSWQRWRPGPHAPSQSRSAKLPVRGSSSSQSTLASIPSPSASVEGTHDPATQVSPTSQRGSQTPGSASRRSPLPSRPPPSLPRGLTAAPLAQAASERASTEKHTAFLEARGITVRLNPIPVDTSTGALSNSRAGARAGRTEKGARDAGA